MANLSAKTEALKLEVDQFIYKGDNEPMLRQQLFETLRSYDKQIGYQLEQIADLEAELDKHGLL